jgi:hypothetical protein
VSRTKARLAHILAIIGIACGSFALAACVLWWTAGESLQLRVSARGIMILRADFIRPRGLLWLAAAFVILLGVGVVLSMRLRPRARWVLAVWPLLFAVALAMQIRLPGRTECPMRGNIAIQCSFGPDDILWPELALGLFALTVPVLLIDRWPPRGFRVVASLVFVTGAALLIREGLIVRFLG